MKKIIILSSLITVSLVGAVSIDDSLPRFINVSKNSDQTSVQQEILIRDCNRTVNLLERHESNTLYVRTKTLFNWMIDIVKQIWNRLIELIINVPDLIPYYKDNNTEEIDNSTVVSNNIYGNTAEVSKKVDTQKVQEDSRETEKSNNYTELDKDINDKFNKILNDFKQLSMALNSRDDNNILSNVINNRIRELEKLNNKGNRDVYIKALMEFCEKILNENNSLTSNKLLSNEQFNRKMGLSIIERVYKYWSSHTGMTLLYNGNMFGVIDDQFKTMDKILKIISTNTKEKCKIYDHILGFVGYINNNSINIENMSPSGVYERFNDFLGIEQSMFEFKNTLESFEKFRKAGDSRIWLNVKKRGYTGTDYINKMIKTITSVKSDTNLKIFKNKLMEHLALIKECEDQVRDVADTAKKMESFYKNISDKISKNENIEDLVYKMKYGSKLNIDIAQQLEIYFEQHINVDQFTMMVRAEEINQILQNIDKQFDIAERIVTEVKDEQFRDKICEDLVNVIVYILNRESDIQNMSSDILQNHIDDYFKSKIRERVKSIKQFGIAMCLIIDRVLSTNSIMKFKSNIYNLIQNYSKVLVGGGNLDQKSNIISAVNYLVSDVLDKLTEYEVIHELGINNTIKHMLNLDVCSTTNINANTDKMVENYLELINQQKGYGWSKESIQTLKNKIKNDCIEKSELMRINENSKSFSQSTPNKMYKLVYDTRDCIDIYNANNNIKANKHNYEQEVRLLIDELNCNFSLLIGERCTGVSNCLLNISRCVQGIATDNSISECKRYMEGMVNKLPVLTDNDPKQIHKLYEIVKIGMDMLIKYLSDKPSNATLSEENLEYMSKVFSSIVKDFRNIENNRANTFNELNKISIEASNSPYVDTEKTGQENNTNQKVDTQKVGKDSNGKINDDNTESVQQLNKVEDWKVELLGAKEAIEKFKDILISKNGFNIEIKRDSVKKSIDGIIQALGSSNTESNASSINLLSRKLVKGFLDILRLSDRVEDTYILEKAKHKLMRKFFESTEGITNDDLVFKVMCNRKVMVVILQDLDKYFQEHIDSEKSKIFVKAKEVSEKIQNAHKKFEIIHKICMNIKDEDQRIKIRDDLNEIIAHILNIESDVQEISSSRLQEDIENYFNITKKPQDKQNYDGKDVEIQNKQNYDGKDVEIQKIEKSLQEMIDYFQGNNREKRISDNMKIIVDLLCNNPYYDSNGDNAEMLYSYLMIDERTQSQGGAFSSLINEIKENKEKIHKDLMEYKKKQSSDRSLMELIQTASEDFGPDSSLGLIQSLVKMKTNLESICRDKELVSTVCNDICLDLCGETADKIRELIDDCINEILKRKNSLNEDNPKLDKFIETLVQLKTNVSNILKINQKMVK